MTKGPKNLTGGRECNGWPLTNDINTAETAMKLCKSNGAKRTRSDKDESLLGITQRQEASLEALHLHFSKMVSLVHQFVRIYFTYDFVFSAKEASVPHKMQVITHRHTPRNKTISEYADMAILNETPCVKIAALLHANVMQHTSHREKGSQCSL